MDIMDLFGTSSNRFNRFAGVSIKMHSPLYNMVSFRGHKKLGLRPDRSL